jgi:hypothetical protein
MNDETGTSLMQILEQRLSENLVACNARTERYGLQLSQSAILALAERRTGALKESGRVEFGESAIPAIIEGFCDSPFLMQENYEETIGELLEAFYYFKNACGDTMTDEELIAAMRERYDYFDGSLDGVIGTSLEFLCRAKLLGQDYDDGTAKEEDEDGDE